MQVGPHGLSHWELRTILSVDEAIPAVEGLNIRDTSHIPAVLLIILKIVLHFKVHGLGGVLEGFGQVLHAHRILNLVNVDYLGSVNVNKDLTVHIIVLNCSVPEWVDHEYILAWSQLNILIKERESETGAESSINELSALLHKDDVELGGFEELLRVLLAVVL